MNEKKDYQGPLYAPHPDLYEKRRKLGLNNKETSRSPIINTEEQMNAEYAAQRKDRMQDAIDDYLNDNKVSARQAYEEMLFGINDVIEYHKSALQRAEQLKSLMTGNREVDLGDYVKDLPAQQNPVYNDDGTTSYEYAAHVTLGDIHKFQRGSVL